MLRFSSHTGRRRLVRTVTQAGAEDLYLYSGKGAPHESGEERMRGSPSAPWVRRSVWPWALCLVGLVAAARQQSMAQVARPYEPVVIAGNTVLADAQLAVKTLRVWAYRTQEDSWQMVPFQVDEINSKVRPWERYFVAEDSLAGILDLDDEVVVMARDFGHKADSSDWPPTSDSLRFELAFHDSLDGATGYLYLHWGDDAAEAPQPYALAYDSAADRIASLAYQVGFNGTGQLADVFISPAVGGAGQDLFDRFKLRLIGSLAIFPIYLDEEFFLAERAYARVGPVRVVRNLDARFKGHVGPVEVDQPFTQTVAFYPYSASFSLPPLPLEGAKELGVKLNVLRASWDMSPSAAGMRFYSAHNLAGVPVDGNGDQIDPTCVPGRLNWTLLTGAQGTMLNLFLVPEFGDHIGLYYHEATNGTTGDGSPLSDDTGDMFSYGDNGFLLSGNIQDYLGPGATLSAAYTNYFLPPEMPPQMAALMCAQAEHPLQLRVSLQGRTSSASAIGRPAACGPGTFVLRAWPNPCHGSATIWFELARPQEIAVDLYDVHGRRIACLAQGERAAGAHVLRWDARTPSGHLLASGIYFVRLNTDRSVVAHKILLLR